MQIDSATTGRVRAAVFSAFGSMGPPPPAEDLVHIPRELDRESAELFRNWIAGRHWQDLRPAVLTDRDLYGFCYLTPAGFHYYIPAMLVAGLAALETPEQFNIERAIAERAEMRAEMEETVKAFKERYGLNSDTSEAPKYEESVQDVAFGVINAVRGMLQPDPCMLYNKGTDPLFDARRHTLSDEQVRAICAYLGMFLAARENTRYAEVLQRGWADVDCAETRQAVRQINAARNYSYASPWPGAADHDANPEIVQAIRDAFRGRAQPAPNRIVEPSWFDERCEPGLKFRDAEWDRIHPSLLNSEDLLWFTEEARDYFLPSYFLADAHGAYMELDLVLNYTRVDWFRRLSMQQQSAVTLYLEWRAPTDSSVAETLEKLKSE